MFHKTSPSPIAARIACRVIATARRLASPPSVYSEAGRWGRAYAVWPTKPAARSGRRPAKLSCLEKILDFTPLRAQAIHPASLPVGEPRDTFAARVCQGGVVFIVSARAAIRAMGLESRVEGR